MKLPKYILLVLIVAASCVVQAQSYMGFGFQVGNNLNEHKNLQDKAIYGGSIFYIQGFKYRLPFHVGIEAELTNLYRKRYNDIGYDDGNNFFEGSDLSVTNRHIYSNLFVRSIAFSRAKLLRPFIDLGWGYGGIPADGNYSYSINGESYNKNKKLFSTGAAHYFGRAGVVIARGDAGVELSARYNYIENATLLNPSTIVASSSSVSASYSKLALSNLQYQIRLIINL